MRRSAAGIAKIELLADSKAEVRTASSKRDTQWGIGRWMWRLSTPTAPNVHTDIFGGVRTTAAFYDLEVWGNLTVSSTGLHVSSASFESQY